MASPREWLEDELRRAILMAYENDAVLFGRGACEQSIIFRIGRYLAPVVEERRPGRLRVDCEYNRVADPMQVRVAKRVMGLGSVPDQKRSVFPDLVIHDRSGSSRDHNILVVEAESPLRTPAGSRSTGGSSRRINASCCTNTPCTSSSRWTPGGSGWVGTVSSYRSPSARSGYQATTQHRWPSRPI
jgi:hypothetical protein